MRRRILVLVVGMTALVVLAFALPLALLIRHVVYDDATRGLVDDANQVANYLRSSFTPPTPAQIATFIDGRWDDRDVSVTVPSSVPVGTLPPAAASLPAAPELGGGDEHGGAPQTSAVSWHGGKLVQLPVLTGPQDGGPGGGPGGAQYLVRVYATDGALHTGETPWWLLLAGSSVGLLLIGVLAGEVITRRIVRPLLYTARTAHQLSVGDTAARAPTDGPREVAEVGTALNRLADRIDELIAEERETVADLSHRMRTPLTALRLEAEALRDPGDAERVGTHVSAMERTLTAVIHAARRPQREGRMPASNATAVVAERVRFWSALADDQGRRFTVTLPAEELLVRASADDLGAAVDALLENVFAHTAEGVAFEVRLWTGPAVDLSAATDGTTEAAPTATVHLAIADHGSGIADDALARGRSDRGSSGLGLDIARRSAEAAGGGMTITRGFAGGAVVTLHFAPADSVTASS
jgi:signal transduction histidine kinase